MGGEDTAQVLELLLTLKATHPNQCHQLSPTPATTLHTFGRGF